MRESDIDPLARGELTVLQWAQARRDNSARIARMREGADRDGWLEDLAYWHAIVQHLAGAPQVQADEAAGILAQQHATFESENAAAEARIRGLRETAETENRRSPWRGQGFTEEADRLELARPALLSAFEAAIHCDHEARALFLLDHEHEIRALLTAAARPAQPETWRCFHCDEVFTEKAEAKEHFGDYPDDSPLCLIKGQDGGLGTRIRELETELIAAYNQRNEYENDARLWHEAEADRRRRIGDCQWWQELDSREGERLVLHERIAALEAAAARQALERQPDTVVSFVRSMGYDAAREVAEADRYLNAIGAPVSAPTGEVYSITGRIVALAALERPQEPFNEREHCRAQVRQELARHGYAPNELQLKFRDGFWDRNLAELAICDALNEQGSIPAHPGDGVSCVAQMIEAHVLKERNR